MDAIRKNENEICQLTTQTLYTYTYIPIYVYNCVRTPPAMCTVFVLLLERKLWVLETPDTK